MLDLFFNHYPAYDPHDPQLAILCDVFNYEANGLLPLCSRCNDAKGQVFKKILACDPLEESWTVSSIPDFPRKLAGYLHENDDMSGLFEELRRRGISQDKADWFSTLWLTVDGIVLDLLDNKL